MRIYNIYFYNQDHLCIDLIKKQATSVLEAINAFLSDRSMQGYDATSIHEVSLDIE